MVVRWFNENKTCRPNSKTRFECKRDSTEGFAVMTESPLLFVGFNGGYRVKGAVITAWEWRVFL